MPDEDKTFSGSFVLDLRISWRQAHTLYTSHGQVSYANLNLQFFQRNDGQEPVTIARDRSL